MKGLILIPAFNEAESIAYIVQELEKWICENVKEDTIDYLVVDDGSTDLTKNILKEGNYNYVSHCINQGIGGPVKTGILYALRHDYDFMLQYDGDGQHMPTPILEMIEALNEGNDIVIGSRFVSSKKPWTMRMIGSRFISLLLYMRVGFKQKVNDPTSGQRMFNKNMLYELSQYAVVSEPPYLSKYINKGYKVKEIQVEMRERETGESHFNFVNSIAYMVEQTLAIIFGY